MPNHNELTVVMAYRNRDVARVRRCLESLGRQSRQDFEVILVDYGSDAAIASAIQDLCAEFASCRVIYSDTRGMPWSRGRALNIGCRRAHTPFTVTTDIDMVFPPHFVDTLLQHADPAKVVGANCTFLPAQFGDWERLFQIGERGSPWPRRLAMGGCQCLATSVLHDIRGFDEYYQYWGLEDRDLINRLKRHGLEEIYLPESVSMYHQWHPETNHKTQGYMPQGQWARMEAHFRRLQSVIVRNDDGWGTALETNCRPVFEHLHADNLAMVESERLHWVDYSPTDRRSAAEWVGRFWELPSGHALAVDNYFYPARVCPADLAVRGVNWLLRRRGIGSSVDYAPNRLHDSIADFVVENGDLVADYYFGLPLGNGVSMVVKA